MEECNQRSAFVLICLLMFSGGVFGTWAADGPSAVRLNEIVASNATGLTDDDGDQPDWIELYNSGPEPVSLSGVGLSDDPEDPFRWVFPDVTLDAHAFLIVWASGKDRTDAETPLHANFSIASAGEALLLTAADGTLIDALPPTPIPTDLSYGRQPDGTGEWYYFIEPTPGASNLTVGFETVLDPPSLSLPAGFYPEPITLTADHTDESVSLHYTLNGDVPTEADPVFPVSLMVGPRSGESNVWSMIDTTRTTSQVNEHWWQPPADLVAKGTTVRVRAFRSNAVPSRTWTATYFADTNLYHHYSMPVVSLVTGGDHLFDYHQGIYVHGPGPGVPQANYSQRGQAWERPVHFEWFDEAGSLRFQQNAGIRIHGQASRSLSYKSVRLYARNQYGESAFDFPFWPDVDEASFKRLLFRNSGQDTANTYMRDALVHRLVGHMRLETQAYRPVVKFINGEYWGIYNVRERYDRFYLERTYGTDPDAVDIVETRWGNQTDLVVKEGDAEHYQAMRDFIVQTGVEDPADYAYIQTQMDTDSYIDFLVANIYANNGDWPGNNAVYWRARTDAYDPDAPSGLDGRWRWMLIDLDHAFWYFANVQRYRPEHNTIAFATQSSHNTWPNPNWATRVIREMLKNESFQNDFINRMSDQLNTAFKPHRVVAVIDAMAAAIEPEISEHHARHHRPWDGYSGWEDEVDRLRSFANQRPAHQFQHMVSYFNKPGLASLEIDVSDLTHGRVRVNSVVIDESTMGLLDPESPYPWSGTYVRAVPITLEALPAPGYVFAGWDGLTNESATVERSLNGDLNVTALFEVDPERAATELLIEWPAHWGQTGAMPPLTVWAVNDEGLVDPGYTGQVTVSVSGPGSLNGEVTVSAVNGVASFDQLSVAGYGPLRFTVVADGLPPMQSEPIRVVRLTETLLPRFIQGEQDADGNNFNRVPFAFYLEFDGLLPEAEYRYGNRIIVPEDPPEQNGAGNMIIVTGSGAPFVRNTDSPRFLAEDYHVRHGVFETDADGAYAGWFITEPTGNPRFSSGQEVQVRILLNDGDGGEAYHHWLTTTGGISVLAFGIGADEGSGLMSEVAPGAGEFVALHDDAAGNGRPIAVTPVEITGSEVDDRYAPFYESIVATNPDYWGTIIPNSLTGGVRRLETYALSTGLEEVEIFADGLPDTVLADHGLAAIFLGEEPEWPLLLVNDHTVWADDDHWSSAQYPSGTDALAEVQAPVAGNRNVDLGADITVGHLRVAVPSHAGRNRIDESTGHHVLRFDADPGPATLDLIGAGAGFVEFQVDGGTWLDTDLRIETSATDGDPEYGVLRLRRGWHGDGGLIKTGPGMMTMSGDDKTYLGETRVEEGILRLTEPATPTFSAAVTVESGGQLRLISGNAPRDYVFSGPLQVAGAGADETHAGGQGALRYEPGPGDHLATVHAATTLSAAPVIHVAESGNRLVLAGPLSGTGPWHKTGPGALAITGTSDGLSGDLIVHEGLVVVDSLLDIPVQLAATTQLSGTGRLGPLRGTGTVAVQPGDALVADSVDGLNLQLPLRSDALFTGLQLTSPVPVTDTAAVHPQWQLFLPTLAPTAASTYRGGLRVETDDTAADALLSAIQPLVYVLDPGGTYHFGGQTFSLYDGPLTPIIEFVPADFLYTDNAMNGQIVRVRFAEGVLPRLQWWADNFTGDELDDPAVSGYGADPDDEHLPNLVRYAHGLDRGDDVEPALPSLQVIEVDGESYIEYRFQRLRHLDAGIIYHIKATESLLDEWGWVGELMEDVEVLPALPVDADVEQIRMRIPLDTAPAGGFIRLRVDAWDVDADP